MVVRGGGAGGLSGSSVVNDVLVEDEEECERSRC